MSQAKTFTQEFILWNASAALLTCLFYPNNIYEYHSLHTVSNKRLSNENRHTFFRFLRNSKYDQKKHIFHTA